MHSLSPIHLHFSTDGFDTLDTLHLLPFDRYYSFTSPREALWGRLVCDLRSKSSTMFEGFKIHT